VKEKYTRTQDTFADTMAVLFAVDSMKHRYEFDLGPRGLELTRMNYGNKPEHQLDESPDSSCWQNAARTAHLTPVSEAKSSEPRANFATSLPPEPNARDGNSLLRQCEIALKIEDRDLSGLDPV